MNGRQPQFTVGSAVAAAFRMLPINEWHHVVFTLSNAHCRAYVDGKLGLFQTNTPLRRPGLAWPAAHDNGAPRGRQCTSA